MDTIELEESVEFMEAKKVNIRIQKEITKGMDALIEAEESKNKKKIKAAEKYLKESQDKLEDVNLEYDYEFNLNIIKAAKEFDKLIDLSENDKNTRMTKSAFLFRSAICMYAVFLLPCKCIYFCCH